ncbi:MAG: hypothetical protein SynsKO_38320 [Synoicihabitans sp.]
MDEDGQAHIKASAPGIMEKEIQLAAAAGLDYWAFLVYQEQNEMSKGLEQYLASPRRGEIDFCLILHNNIGLTEEEWLYEQDRLIELMQEPGYVMVEGDRPLVYMFSQAFDGSIPRARFAGLRTALATNGLDPYFVFMGWKPLDDFTKKKPLGFSAVSAYAYASDVPTFKELTELVERDYWQPARDHRIPFVPFVTTGWDKRPRQDHPVPWEPLDRAYHEQETFPSMATPDEIESVLRKALQLVQHEPDLCVANAVIIYAWNENDEGGWLAPTWRPSGAPNYERLEAIRRVLRPDGIPFPIGK